LCIPTQGILKDASFIWLILHFLRAFGNLFLIENENWASLTIWAVPICELFYLPLAGTVEAGIKGFF
jgi:hypothetical protein